MSSTDYTVPASSCPKCQKELNGALSMPDSAVAPKPGDLTVCAYCFAALEFGPELKLELVDEEALELEVLWLITQVRRHIKRAHLQAGGAR